MREIGTRVLAIASAKDGVVFSFGEGTLVGNREVPEHRGGFTKDDFTWTNLCIELDSGEVVFGHECWWGPIDQMKEKFAGMEFQPYSIKDFYAKEEK